MCDLVENLKQMIADAGLADPERTDLNSAREYLERLQEYLDRIDMYDVTTPSLGFYTAMTKETISIDKSIYDGMNKSFEKVEE